MFYHDYELGKSSKILTEELFKLKPGESFIITADTETDPHVADAIARAAFALDAKPMVIWTASGLGCGKVLDSFLPSKPLTAALKEADAWVELNNKWIFYSTIYDTAIKENKKLRYLNLVGMTPDMMTRLIGRVNYPVLKIFLEKITKMTENAKHVRFTTPAGTDLEFEHLKTSEGKPDPHHPFSAEFGDVSAPGAHMLAGQIGWVPDLDSINGLLVFDGTVDPPCRKLEEPICLTIKSGTVTKIAGGKQAVEYEIWLKSFNDPQMFRLAHACYGFNPGAHLSGDIVEDERIWGCTEWGLGNVGPQLLTPNGISGASHSDGICLNSSVWLDGKQIMDKGQMIDSHLAELAHKLGR
jgi:leucyl aminopeptidase (aminopeptidase T)